MASSQLLGELKSGLLGLGNSVIPLGGVELDVAVGREVGGNTTVGAVGSSTALLSALADGVGDNALVGVEALGLAVGLQVLEELTDISGHLPVLVPTSLHWACLWAKCFL